MKIKSVLLMCGIALVAVLGGCGSVAANEQNTVANESEVEIIDFGTSDAEDISDETSAEKEEGDSVDEKEGEESKETSDQATKEALKAYYEILSSMPAIEGEHDEIDNAAFGYEENHAMFGDHLDAFLVYDINKDGVPELIASSTVNFRWEPIYVYTYADGQAVLLKDPVQPDSHGTFEQNASANGGYLTYFCDNNHIHSFWGGNVMDEQMVEDYAYELNGTELILTDCDNDCEGVFFNYDTMKPNTEEYISYMVQ